MGRHKRPRHIDRFALIPLSVLESPDLQALNGSAYRVLLAVAGQFNGYNNGHMTMTEQDGVRFGIRKQTVTVALSALQQAGLIVKTHQGGLRPYGPNRWALPWQPLNYRNCRQIDPPRTIAVWTNEMWAIENRSTGAESAPRTGAQSALQKSGNGCGQRTTADRSTGMESAPQYRISPRVRSSRTDSETDNGPRNGADNGG